MTQSSPTTGPYVRAKKCELCLGTGALIEDQMMMVVPCWECHKTAEEYENTYGTDEKENPVIYAHTDDQGRTSLQKIDRKKDFLLMPDGTEIDLAPHKPFIS